MLNKNNGHYKYEILFLTSYPGLDEIAIPLFKEIETEYSNKITKYKSLPFSDEEIIKNIDDGCKVIISRGYPATACKRLTNKHVIEIEVTFQDVINAINKVMSNDTKRIAIIAYSNIVNEKNDIIKLGDIELYFLTLKNRKKDEDIINNYLKDKKIDAVVGSALVYETTKRINVPFEMIRSSRESVLKAMQESTLFIDNDKILNKKKSIQIRNNMEKGWTARYTFNDILGKSKAIEQARIMARRYAKSHRNILITGETGTGKELLAQSIHNESDRFDKPFISINCGELSENLIESELFGYEGGSYTGANKYGSKGLLISANEGTLFLDEISEASMKVQIKILRVIEERKIRRVGSNKLENIDIRLICATNKDLKSLVEKNLFKKDLYYRLNELEIESPSLKKRKEDICYLAKYFTKKEYYNEYRRNVKLEEKMFNILLKYDWPGNIRELKSFLLKLVYYSEGKNIDERIVNNYSEQTFGNEVVNAMKYIKIPIIKDRKILDKEIYKELLQFYNGDKQQLCEDFEINRTTLWRKLNGK